MLEKTKQKNLNQTKGKNLIELAVILVVSVGIFLFASYVSAASLGVECSTKADDKLQPTMKVTHNEDLTVNATGIFNSIKVGKQGVGGVTFFNGTIVNSTTDNGVDNPVTFGDDVRIDGDIFRTEKGGDNELKVYDDISVEGNLLVSGSINATNTIEVPYLKSTIMFQMPVLASVPSPLSCERDSDLGKAVMYYADEYNMGIAYCVLSGGSYTWWQQVPN